MNVSQRIKIYSVKLKEVYHSLQFELYNRVIIETFNMQYGLGKDKHFFVFVSLQ
jgi:hypothetical protein